MFDEILFGNGVDLAGVVFTPETATETLDLGKKNKYQIPAAINRQAKIISHIRQPPRRLSITCMMRLL